MRRLLLTALVAVLLATGATACQRPHQDPLTVHRAILVGDSLAHGAFGAPGLGTYLPGLFPNASFLGAGGLATGPLDGFDPATGASNWSRQISDIVHGGYDADLVIIQAYGKDYTDAAQWRAALDGIVAAARADDPEADRRIVMVTSPRIVPGTSPWFEAGGIPPQLAGSNAVMRSYPDIGLADVDAAWAVDDQPVWDVPGLGVPRYADGFHYNDVGAADGARIVSLA